MVSVVNANLNEGSLHTQGAHILRKGDNTHRFQHYIK